VKLLANVFVLSRCEVGVSGNADAVLIFPLNSGDSFVTCGDIDSTLGSGNVGSGNALLAGVEGSKKALEIAGIAKTV